MKFFQTGALALLLMVAPTAHAAGPQMPWGSAEEIHQEYKEQKVVYDVTSGDTKFISNILDRASLLSKLNGANPLDTRIVIMIHGSAIPLFAAASYERNRELVKRAQSLSVGNVVEFRMCQASAKMQGFLPADIHGFIKMVPMADAEIVRLQQEEGFAYMR